MLDWIKKLTTESDNESPCIIKIAVAIGSMNGFGLAAYDVIWQHAHFDVQSYGIGLGAIIGAIGAGLKWKPEGK